jgi:proteasome assembly chaperone (PAC2) family protein
MTLLVDVLDEDGLHASDIVLFALPGVGDVGKNAIELLNEANNATPVARFIHPGLTPLARLDEDGLLAPPHLIAKRIELEGGRSLLTITGRGQPSESFQQHDFSTELLKHLSDSKIDEIIVLAGLMSTPEVKEAFAVATSSSHRVKLEKRGIEVRRDQPSGGAIGMSALMASLAPMFGLSSVCAMATTVGASGDVHASIRLLEFISKGWNLHVRLPEDATSKVLAKLNELAPNGTTDHVRELMEEPDAFYI